ncbi:nucleoside-diphosphate-sugar epimerase [Albidovulum inexpectatum]|uniref:Nucleoside-diphosphate-sugar epimerase n=1 Tax=Albidovulum inexpectatum TaxID=196587 RepID=A0A2S5JJZ4_9RHOB|nr:SDR family oxidoreductase [Albidovulum inexpectatum]PPB81575.1 nucleoside-diphosphate-sugar epimerase [Albidovulum inexpectatum]
MRILIIGHRGYVGPVAARHLAGAIPGAELHGLDAEWFVGAESGQIPDDVFVSQRRGDIRDLHARDLEGFDAVVALAAVSNDPIGKEFEAATEAINANGVLNAARAARQARVRHFVFASSCSMYGAGSDSFRREDDQLNPLTAYARSKVAAEQGLQDLATEDFRVTALRFATACGASPMLRLDLVLNDFVATAITTGRIEVLSDGSPWRPLIHVDDMARAIEWALVRDGEPHVAVNVGSQSWTWQIGQLARDVGAALGGVAVDINRDAAPDNRSYRVDFTRFSELAPDHQPQKDFGEAVAELASQVRALSLSDTGVRGSRFIRLNVLRDHVQAGRLDKDLRWAG